MTASNGYARSSRRWSLAWAPKGSISAVKLRWLHSSRSPSQRWTAGSHCGKSAGSSLVHGGSRDEVDPERRLGIVGLVAIQPADRLALGGEKRGLRADGEADAARAEPHCGSRRTRSAASACSRWLASGRSGSPVRWSARAGQKGKEASAVPGLDHAVVGGARHRGRREPLLGPGPHRAQRGLPHVAERRASPLEAGEHVALRVHRDRRAPQAAVRAAGGPLLLRQLPEGLEVAEHPLDGLRGRTEGERTGVAVVARGEDGIEPPGHAALARDPPHALDLALVEAGEGRLQHDPHASPEEPVEAPEHRVEGPRRRRRAVVGLRGRPVEAQLHGKRPQDGDLVGESVGDERAVRQDAQGEGALAGAAGDGEELGVGEGLAAGERDVEAAERAQVVEDARPTLRRRAPGGRGGAGCSRRRSASCSGR